MEEDIANLPLKELLKKYPTKVLGELLAKKDNKKLDKIKDKIAEARKDLNPYSRIIEGSDNILSFSFTPMQKDYQTKLLTTGMIAYLNRACDEYHCPKNVPVVSVYDYVQNPSLIDPPEPADPNVGLLPDIKEAYEENRKWMEHRVIIKQFLEEVFRYDPDRDVSSAYKPNLKDPERSVVKTPSAQLAVLMEAKRVRRSKKTTMKEKKEAKELVDEYKKVVETSPVEEKKTEHEYIKILKGRDGKEMKVKRKVLCTDSEFQDMVNSGQVQLPSENHVFNDDEVIITEKGAEFTPIDWAHYFNRQKVAKDLTTHKVVRDMIPPFEFFARFVNYMDSNYEEILRAVKDLYCEKPDIDWGICPHNWHKDMAEAREYRRKHQNEMGWNIYAVQSGLWSLIGPYKENRDRLDFYGSNMHIFEEMFKMGENAQKLHQDMLKKRIKKVKKENIAKTGKDHPAISKFSKNHETLAKYGIDNDMEDINDETPDDAIEVPIHIIEEGGLKMKQTKYYTETSAPETVPGMAPPVNTGNL